jgi:hypothetical protein
MAASDAFITGVAVVMGIGAAINLLGVLVSWRMLPRRAPEPTDPNGASLPDPGRGSSGLAT